MPTLADIYSMIDSAKRRGTDFIRNPGTSLQQIVGNANDRARVFNELNDAALDEFRATGDLYGPKNKELAQSLAGAYNPVGMTVWHGSPYKFTNFDASKIGKGEGAQVYGHGLYVAENPAVAQQYQQNVKDLDSIQAYNLRLKQLNKLMDEDSVYPGAYRKFKSEKGQKAADEYDALMEMRNQKSTDKGNLYKIDLPDEHIEMMLDWDKPLSKDAPQKVKDAFNKIIKDHPELKDKFIKAFQEGKPGNHYYSLLNDYAKTGDLVKNQVFASKVLQESGIPGIKYLDQSSRGAGKGTRNFVVFPGNEHLLKIQDINGNPLK